MRRILCSATAVMLLAAVGFAESIMTLSGDGLTVTILQLSEEDGTVSGEIRREGATYPFTGRIAAEGDAEVVHGTFTAGGESFPFTSRQEDGSDVVVFTTGGHSYRLRQAEVAPAPQPDNPLGRKPENPLTGAAPPPAAKVNPGAPNAPAPAAAAAAAPEMMRLKRHNFHDVTMGNVVAYTMLLPEDWTATGHIEWSFGDTTYPQKRIQIITPQKGKLIFVPTMNFSYTEVNPVPGFAPIPPQGTPPPQNVGEWLVSFLRQNNSKVSNLRLVEDRRDPRAEAASAEMARQLGANRQGIREEVHIITYDYDQDGTRFREEVTLSYVQHEPIINENIRAYLWTIFTSSVVAAPESTFAQLKPQLLAVASTLQPTAKWWVQMQEALMEITRVRAEAQAEAIRRRGQMYDRMSDAQHENFKKHMASGDVAQNDRINAIYEVSDFKDTDGSSVKLPFQYHHVYSDGNGNYVLTNNSLNKPGETWKEIEPVK